MLVRGGGKASDEEILSRTEALIKQGAAGIVYGRNIIQHHDPAGMTRALMAIVHENATAATAAKLIRSSLAPISVSSSSHRASAITAQRTHPLRPAFMEHGVSLAGIRGSSADLARKISCHRNYQSDITAIIPLNSYDAIHPNSQQQHTAKRSCALSPAH